ncbi:hypothetical protein E6R18_25225 [Streptomyces sp. A1277]|uniref:replicative DNA helicase n=1 Tax=Streptomyces sp. A1277 TaxID=2563103 RepID=UPI0010A25B97|nr:DnaB-like helicase C-terminal domain-containing protein [Streptomyces sp. A1277]THA29213.1 hypothetical protein E6R18_25225 [Streptomyces sp. A1277]
MAVSTNTEELTNQQGDALTIQEAPVTDTADGDGQQEPISLHHSLESALDHVESAALVERGATGISTGFRDLDWVTTGLHPGTLTVLASRPAVGRTTLLNSICQQAGIVDKCPLLHVSLESSIEETTLRFLASAGRIPLHHLRAGTLDETLRPRLDRVVPRLAEGRMHLWAPAQVTFDQLAERARRYRDLFGIKLIAVDGIQDIRPRKRNDLREREVGDVARDLKSLARELGVAVLATAHLNRAPEQRVDRTPAIDDLRESGAITFAADTIILIHRPDAYVKDHPRMGEADLLVAKHREGPTVTLLTAFQGHYSRFVDMATT